MTLLSSQKQRLRQRAHALKPVIIIGNHGLTEAVQNEINRALDDHELIKIKVNAETREDRQMMINEICEIQHAELVQSIGHIAVVYRKNEEK